MGSPPFTVLGFVASADREPTNFKDRICRRPTNFKVGLQQDFAQSRAFYPENIWLQFCEVKHVRPPVVVQRLALLATVVASVLASL